MSDLAMAPQPSPVPMQAVAIGRESVPEVTNSPIESEPKPAAPSDAVAAPSRRSRLGWYAGTIFLSCFLVFFGLRLDKADLNAPFYYDLDSLLIMPLVKATVERGLGGHWRNERMGAPLLLELHDFPVIDHLHFLLIWILSKFFSNFAFVYNFYYLLTFPLTALTAMAAFRHLGLTLPAASVGAILYAFLPYHYQRWENHYFLSAYWLIPLSMLPVLAISRGDFPFFRKCTEGRFRWQLFSWASARQLLLGAAAASAGAYYAFFTCAYLAFAGLYAIVSLRKWQAAASAAALIATILVFGIVNHVPTILYQSANGRNAVTDRSPEEADEYGMKIAHLLLPIEDHNLSYFAKLKRLYNTANRPLENENKAASLGAVGALGFLGLMCSLLLPGRPVWPYRALTLFALFGVLLGTIGGFGAIFNTYVTAQIRAYNRISVFIAFFCVFASLWFVDRYLTIRQRTIRALDLSYALLAPFWIALSVVRWSASSLREPIDRFWTRLQPRRVSIELMVWGFILLFGFLDQTPYSWFGEGIVRDLDEQAVRYRADDEFFGEIERTLPPGAKVFCLPYVPFPEYPPVQRMATYEHSRGFLHTKTLLWSYGGMKGREGDAWVQEVSSRGTEELLQRIVYRGFDGLFIDKRGYPTATEASGAYALINSIDSIYTRLVDKRNARLPEIIHSDGQQIFLDLRPYREALRSVSPSFFEAKVREEQEWLAVTWLGGFYTPGLYGDEGFVRFGPKDGWACFINNADRTRTFLVSMTLDPVSSGLFEIKFSGLIDAEFTLEHKFQEKESKKAGVEKQYKIEIPPGRHWLRIRCTPPPGFIPSDNRNLCYTVLDFKVKEIR